MLSTRNILLNLRILLCAVQHAFICYLHICSSLPFINIHNKEILFACQIIKERVIQLCNQRIDRSSVEYDLTEIADICNDIFYEENDDENQNHGKSHHWSIIFHILAHLSCMLYFLYIKKECLRSLSRFCRQRRAESMKILVSGNIPRNIGLYVSSSMIAGSVLSLLYANMNEEYFNHRLRYHRCCSDLHQM